MFVAGGLEPICLSSPTKLWHFGGWVVWSTTCTCINFRVCGKRLSQRPHPTYFYWFMVFERFIIVDFIWCQLWSRWSFGRTSIIRWVLRRLICFSFYLHVYRTQFLMDLFKDPILSSVCVCGWVCVCLCVCVWGHTLFLRASRCCWSFLNMFHCSRGAGCPCKYQPNEEACMRHWYHWRRPVTYLPFISDLICRYGKGLSREPQNTNFSCHFTKQLLDQWLSHAAQGLSGISFPDVIELTRKTGRFDGPIRTPYDIRSFKCVCVCVKASVCIRPRFRHGPVVIRWFAGLGFLPLIWWVFPSWNSFWFICPCSALTRPYQHYGDVFSDWVDNDSPTDFLW